MEKISLVEPTEKIVLIEPIVQNNNNFYQLGNPNETKLISNSYYNDIVVLDNIPEYDMQDYDISDDKGFKKYIEDIKKIIRSSFEYRRFVNYLREYMNMNKCSFFNNVTNANTFKIKIELHHSPLTLHDIVLTIFNKRVFYHESLEVEMVAKEVMYVHYFLMVGIIPLAETVHELVHKQLIFIPLNAVLGNYEDFIEMYNQWIPDEVTEKLQVIREKSKVYDNALNASILQQNPIILQLPGDTGQGLYNLPTMEQIESLMADRILEIKENHYKLPVKDSDIAKP